MWVLGPSGTWPCTPPGARVPFQAWSEMCWHSEGAPEVWEVRCGLDTYYGQAKAMGVMHASGWSQAS